jgi:hypothetical protein
MVMGECLISNTEVVARILNKDWFDEGKLMHVAFTLRQGETYLSVNRPSISTFEEDVKSFVITHPSYAFDENTMGFRCASLNVGDVRNIQVELDERMIKVEVEVEPRNTHVKSHAGIFTRYKNKNLKMGDSISDNDTKVCYSADAILLKVRLQLLRMAKY